ncbi:hypothetical protein B296_00032412 [Ensete ventricosum]|uniref:Uncharacterized protein n=1 Tax=Ensete ventricosum TaxID=4639 RepID=A0A426XJC2_ENSVE|nr:hypothetical protein B296_00032412 [Ensete ventricosum]
METLTLSSPRRWSRSDGGVARPLRIHDSVVRPPQRRVYHDQEQADRQRYQYVGRRVGLQQRNQRHRR